MSGAPPRAAAFTGYDRPVLELIFGYLEAVALFLQEPLVRAYRRLRITFHRWRASSR
jgi:hypothetical protein